MSEKTEKLIIVGPSGSGKDYLRRGLIKKNLKYSPKFTTRPKRENETDGVDYHFISNEEFERLNKNEEIKVYQSFKIVDQTWNYGITTENFICNQLFIMTPHEISQLTDKDLSGCFLVYLDIPMDVRRKRLFRRNDKNDSIERRLKSDEDDFKNYNLYDLKITDSDFDADSIYDLMF
jgi:guanylate kinase